MDFEDAARKLLLAVNGDVTSANIAGVVSVFETIVDVNNLNWEQWVTEETNESLAQDNIKCDCGAKIKVIRSRNEVYVDII